MSAHRRLLVGVVLTAAVFSACGGSASVQDRAADAVKAFIAADDTLADADFDSDRVASTAAGMLSTSGVRAIS